MASRIGQAYDLIPIGTNGATAFTSTEFQTQQMGVVTISFKITTPATVGGTGNLVLNIRGSNYGGSASPPNLNASIISPTPTGVSIASGALTFTNATYLAGTNEITLLLSGIPQFVSCAWVPGTATAGTITIASRIFGWSS
jgi:hypothetical protein